MCDFLFVVQVFSSKLLSLYSRPRQRVKHKAHADALLTPRHLMCETKKRTPSWKPDSPRCGMPQVGLNGNGNTALRLRAAGGRILPGRKPASSSRLRAASGSVGGRCGRVVNLLRSKFEKEMPPLLAGKDAPSIQEALAQAIDEVLKDLHDGKDDSLTP